MGLRVNQNIEAFNSYRNLSSTQGAMSKSLEKLSSGLRINRAADDAAGLAISEGLRTQVGGLKVAARNAQDGISVVQTAEGALTEVHAILQRMRDLAVQSANGSNNQASRDALHAETTQLKDELDRIASSTSFNGVKLLDGTFAGMNFQVGADAPDSIGVAIGRLVESSSVSTYVTTVDLSQDFRGASAITFAVDGAPITLSSDLSGADAATITTALQAAYDSAKATGSPDYRFSYDDTTTRLVITTSDRGAGLAAPTVTGALSGGLGLAGVDSNQPSVYQQTIALAADWSSSTTGTSYTPLDLSFDVDGVTLDITTDMSGFTDGQITTELQNAYDAAKTGSDEDYVLAYSGGTLTMTSTTTGTAANAPVATGDVNGGVANAGQPASPATYDHTISLANDYSTTPLSFTVDGLAVSVTTDMTGFIDAQVTTALQNAYAAADTAAGGGPEDYQFSYAGGALSVSSTTTGAGAAGPTVTGDLAGGTPTSGAAATSATYSQAIALQNDYSQGIPGVPAQPLDLSFGVDGLAIDIAADMTGFTDAQVAADLQNAYDTASGAAGAYTFAYSGGVLTVSSAATGDGVPPASMTGDVSGGEFLSGVTAGGAPTYQSVGSAGLGIDGVDISTGAGATAALNVLDRAITSVSTVRADLGAVQNRFEHTINNVNVAIENLSASESRIRDTDMALEMTQFT